MDENPLLNNNTDRYEESNVEYIDEDERLPRKISLSSLDR